MPTPADAAALKANFQGNFFTLADGATEYGVSEDASQFVVLTIDTTAVTLTKPNCDNYDDCDTTTTTPTTPTT